MSSYVTLLGAEDVARASATMEAAAEQMRRAAASFDSSVDRLTAAMQEHALRMETVVERMEQLKDQ